MLSLVCSPALPAFAQADQPSSGFGFKLGIGIGVQTFNDTNPPTTWQSLSLYSRTSPSESSASGSTSR